MPKSESTRPICPIMSAVFYLKYFDSAGYAKHIIVLMKFVI